jgi:hypothetical protein
VATLANGGKTFLSAGAAHWLSSKLVIGSIGGFTSAAVKGTTEGKKFGEIAFDVTVGTIAGAAAGSVFDAFPVAKSLGKISSAGAAFSQIFSPEFSLRKGLETAGVQAVKGMVKIVSTDMNPLWGGEDKAFKGFSDGAGSFAVNLVKVPAQEIAKEFVKVTESLTYFTLPGFQMLTQTLERANQYAGGGR